MINNHIVNEWIEACKEFNQFGFFNEYPLDDRVLRLFAVACCREVWDKLIDEQSKKAVEIAELYADGLVGEKELRKARDDAVKVRDDAYYAATAYYASSAAYYASSAASYAFHPVPVISYKQQGIILVQMYLVDFNNNWINSTTTSLAKQIYDNKDFSLMPILADALQDVDCNEEILSHLRGAGPFYKGNYIIDKLIGKR